MIAILAFLTGAPRVFSQEAPRPEDPAQPVLIVIPSGDTEIRIQRPSPRNQIRALSFDPKEARIRLNPSDKNADLVLEIGGTYNSPGDSLILGSKAFRPQGNENDRFRFSIPLKQYQQKERFISVASDGTETEETVEVTISNWAELRRIADSGISRRFHSSVGMGYSAISYQDFRIPPFHETAFTGKASAAYSIVPRRWEAQVGAYLTLLPVTRSAAVSARFFGLNGRIGYVPTHGWSRWQFTVYAGIYYMTMIVSPPEFGYRNVAGPQLYPEVKYRFNNGNIAAGYCKYSPVGTSSSSLGFGSREIAFGLSYLFQLKNQRSWGPTLDVAFQDLVIDSQPFNSSSWTLGASYSF